MAFSKREGIPDDYEKKIENRKCSVRSRFIRSVFCRIANGGSGGNVKC